MENYPKLNRYYHFQVKIFLFPTNLDIQLWSDHQSLISVLKVHRFVTQKTLEVMLSTFKVKYFQKWIELQDFSVQLESEPGSNNIYWNIFLQTNSLTTARFIARKFSEKLYQSEDRIISTIKARTNSKLESLKRKNEFFIPDSDWFPTYFNKNILEVGNLLEKSEFLEDFLKTGKLEKSIQKHPKKYEPLVKDLLEICQNS